MMTTIEDLRDSSKQEIVTLYGASFQYPDGEFRKNQKSMELNPHSCYGNHHNSSLARYKSAPSSFFDSSCCGGEKEYRFCSSSSPEMDLMDRFLSPGTCSAGSNSKQETSNRNLNLPTTFQFHDLSYMNGGNCIERSFGIVGSDDSNSLLSRQNSSPAMFSNLGLLNGGESSPQQSRINFSLGSIYSEDENFGNSLKKCGNEDDEMSFSLVSKNFSAMEKLYQLQGVVPCKIRAKRGFATHPRSIAERQRRTRISERMRKLQNLFPNMEKQTSTADMLEAAVERIKELENQVKKLKDTKARCIC